MKRRPKATAKTWKKSNSCVLRHSLTGAWTSESDAGDGLIVLVAGAAVRRLHTITQAMDASLDIGVGVEYRLRMSAESFRDWSNAVDAGKTYISNLPVDALIRVIKVRPTFPAEASN